MLNIHDRVTTHDGGRRRVWRVEAIIVERGIVLARRMTGDGLLLDLRSEHTIARIPIAEATLFCTACRGQHNAQHCPEIRQAMSRPPVPSSIDN